MIKKEVVDNTDIKMSEIINENIGLAESIDIATGYFDMGGYTTVRMNLEKKAEDPAFRLRMLMGAEAMVRSQGFEKLRELYGTGAEHEAFVHSTREDNDALPLKDRIDYEKLSARGFDDTNGLIKLLGRDNVYVRLSNKRFNHAKCYIFGDMVSAFVGSSNFTRPGLEKNDELNVGLYQPSSLDITKNWFERVWKKGKDGKQHLIDQLTQSKFGAPADPYSVYMKMLFEEYRDYLMDAGKETIATKDLAKFQKEAVRNTIYMLSRYGGAIISDSTGLGKTNMGIEILRQKNREGKKMLLIAPAQVLNSMWRMKLDDAQIRPKTISVEHLSRIDVATLRKNYRKINFVLIDESQNFRNKNSNRWQNLMKLIHGIGKQKQVVMLSATPINNSIMDLYYQLCIITNQDDAFFYESTGIRNLYLHMKEAARKDNLSQGLEQIQYLLGKIMVRRTRSHIKELYPTDTIDGKPIMFPRHNYYPIKYSLSDIFGNIYEKIINSFETLVGTPYCIEYYNKSLDSAERSKHAGLGKLQTINLLKRFESSIVAAKVTLANKISLYIQFQNMLERGEMLRTSDFNKIMAKWTKYVNDGDNDIDIDMVDEDEFFTRELKKINTEKTTLYDVAAMGRDLKSDLKILKTMLAEVEKVERKFDKKFEAVRDAIQRDNALEYNEKKTSGKVLVFSEYTATAKYVKDRLADTFKNKKVELIHGGIAKKARQKIIEGFAPNANLLDGTEEPESKIDILVSTEVMSEGQNLQDCNYVVNYDLPWNPMRMVQRTGRVDRLASAYDNVTSRACYPDKDLDDLLNLKARLIRKVQVVNELIGIESPLMGEVPKPKQYAGIAQVLSDLSKGSNTDVIVGRLQEESDLMGPSLLSELTKYVTKIGKNKMHNESMGRRSGKKWLEQKAVLAYLKSPKRSIYFVVYDYKTKKAEISANPDDAIRMAQSRSDDAIHLPMDGADHRESFLELLEIDKVAVAAIDKWQKGVYIYRNKTARERKDTHDKNLTVLKGILKEAVRGGAIDGNHAGRILEIARSNLRVWQDELKAILNDYGRDGDLNGLISSISSMSDRLEHDDEAETEVKSVADVEDDSRLTLVGAMFLSGDKFDYGHDRL